MNIEEKKEILRNVCINTIGRDFCRIHLDQICKAFGESDKGLYCFYGISLTPPDNNAIKLTHENNWDIYVIAEFDEEDNPYVSESRGIPVEQ